MSGRQFGSPSRCHAVSPPLRLTARTHIEPRLIFSWLVLADKKAACPPLAGQARAHAVTSRRLLGLMKSIRPSADKCEQKFGTVSLYLLSRSNGRRSTRDTSPKSARYAEYLRRRHVKRDVVIIPKLDAAINIQSIVIEASSLHLVIGQSSHFRSPDRIYR